MGAPEPPVLAAGLTRLVVLDGTAYLLAAPTLGEAAAMLLAEMQPPVASQARLHAAMAAWLEDNGQADLAARLAGLAAAEEDLLALLGTAPPEYDRDGIAAWRAEVREEERALRRALLRARAAAEPAELAAWDAPAVVRLREDGAGAALRAARRHVAVALREVDGVPVPRVTAALDALLDALPMPHVLALAPRAQALLRPSEDARKN